MKEAAGVAQYYFTREIPEVFNKAETTTIEKHCKGFILVDTRKGYRAIKCLGGLWIREEYVDF